MSAAEVAGGAARAGKSRESRIGICKVPSGLLLPRPGNNAALVSVHPGSCCCQDAHYRLHAQVPPPSIFVYITLVTVLAL